MSFEHPKQLIEELIAGGEAAREELKRICGQDLRRCCIARFTELAAAEALVDAALRWVAMYLASRGPSWPGAFADEPAAGFQEFRALVLCVIQRRLWWEEPPADVLRSHCSRQAEHRSHFYWSFGDAGTPTIAGAPPVSGYELGLFQRPKFVLSGDIIEVAFQEGGVWLLVADGCGKGPVVHLLMQGLGLLWKRLASEDIASPGELLIRLQEAIEPHLPEGVFAEAAIARLEPSGRIVVGTAGGIGVLCRGGEPVGLQFPGGFLLGSIDYGVTRQQGEFVWDMEPGHEIVLCTDGFLDQTIGDGRRSVRTRIDDLLAACFAWPSLHDYVVHQLQQLLCHEQQDDDLSLASIRVL